MNDILLTGGFATILIFILAHLGATVWWMAKVTTTLGYIDRDLKANLLAIKEESLKRSNDITAMWNRIDEMKVQILELKNG